MTAQAMADVPHWWKKPRQVAVVVDNPSWMLPYAEKLVADVRDDGDHCALYRDYWELPAGAIAFFLGCVRIAPKEVIDRNHCSLLVHASPLPRGRGFSPLTYLILEGSNDVPVCLLNADEEIDAGAVLYRDVIHYEGHELIDELREHLGNASIVLCRRFLAELAPPAGEAQVGTPSHYPRRRPEDSVLDPDTTIAQQFNLLRTVDNDRYPAFFDFKGHRYLIRIYKQDVAKHD